ncbi:MAG: helix-turn-helix domain-containing protein [Candidatus Cybelea sp.]
MPSIEQVFDMKKNIDLAATSGNSPPSRLYLTPKQLAERFSVSPAMAYKLIGTTFRCLRVGGCVRVLLADVIDYEKSHLSAAP